jgi:hypothetical protein
MDALKKVDNFILERLPVFKLSKLNSCYILPAVLALKKGTQLFGAADGYPN